MAVTKILKCKPIKNGAEAPFDNAHYAAVLLRHGGN
ncbi:hypothetical protein EPIR_1465 [Erwinia piriflorinigrans CFBP 5888]|uniref:Uncharacterized protein n=1 Tax=Erwinia piriflorinigrans CFBP 5888 TaxID=1161919 RepID=V5Z726_9GAMM|nr:hypothetical protein EPIR_1465 [Erwinia piriflorinigrans CFBP 5888]